MLGGPRLLKGLTIRELQAVGIDFLQLPQTRLPNDAKNTVQSELVKNVG